MRAVGAGGGLDCVGDLVERFGLALGEEGFEAVDAEEVERCALWRSLGFGFDAAVGVEGEQIARLEGDGCRVECGLGDDACWESG